MMVTWQRVKELPKKISEFQVEIKLNRSRADTLIIKLQELQSLSFKNLADTKYS